MVIQILHCVTKDSWSLIHSLTFLSAMVDLYVIHGGILSAAFLVLIPSAILAARLGTLYKGWFLSHVVLNVAGILAVATGVGLGVSMTTNHMTSPHKIIGVTVAGAIALQLILGALLALLWKPDRHLRGLAILHHSLGRTIVVLAWINIIYGLIKVNSELWSYITAGVLIAVWSVTYIGTLL